MAGTMTKCSVGCGRTARVVGPQAHEYVWRCDSCSEGLKRDPAYAPEPIGVRAQRVGQQKQAKVKR
jgi:hypothetical protein